MPGNLQATAQERDLGVGNNSSVNHQLSGQNRLGLRLVKRQFEEGSNANK